MCYCVRVREYCVIISSWCDIIRNVSRSFQRWKVIVTMLTVLVMTPRLPPDTRGQGMTGFCPETSSYTPEDDHKGCQTQSVSEDIMRQSEFKLYLFLQRVLFSLYGINLGCYDERVSQDKVSVTLDNGSIFLLLCALETLNKICELKKWWIIVPAIENGWRQSGYRMEQLSTVKIVDRGVGLVYWCWYWEEVSIVFPW